MERKKGQSMDRALVVKPPSATIRLPKGMPFYWPSVVNTQRGGQSNRKMGNSRKIGGNDE